MIELLNYQLEEMKKLIKFHLHEHKKLQPLQAIQELAELQQELTKVMIALELSETPNYLNLYGELFDAYILLLTVYGMYVKQHGQEEMFKLIADQKIQREKARWQIE